MMKPPVRKARLLQAFLFEWLMQRKQNSWVMPVALFLAVMFVIPIILNSDIAILAMIAPIMLWVILLLASVLSADTMLKADLDDGTLDQIYLFSGLLGWWQFITVKILVRWLLVGLPLGVIAVVTKLLWDGDFSHFQLSLIAVMLGTGAFSCFAVFGSSLVALGKGQGALIAVVILPLSLPVLVLGQAAMYDVWNLLQLLVLVVFYLIFFPIATVFIANLYRYE